MWWMEQCAYIAASRVGRGTHLLTGGMDSLAFSQPTRVGDIMYITAQVISPAFFTSVQILSTSVSLDNFNILYYFSQFFQIFLYKFLSILVL